MDVLARVKINLRAAGDALAVHREHLEDLNHFDVVDRQSTEIGGSGEREEKESLGTFAGDLVGIADLLRDRIADVEESIELLSRAEIILGQRSRVRLAARVPERTQSGTSGPAIRSGSHHDIPPCAVGTFSPKLAEAG